MEMVVRLDGAVAKVLEGLVDMGYYKTKTEAIRAGILELGREFRMIGMSEDDLVVQKMMEMEKELKSGKKKTLSWKEVEAKYGGK